MSETSPSTLESPSGKQRRRFHLSRRKVLQAAAVSALAGFVSSIVPSVPQPDHPEDLAPFIPRIQGIRDSLHRVAHEWAMAGTDALRRPGDRQVYAVDVGQFMHYFAMVGDEQPYLIMREYAQKHLVVDIPGQKFTRGFVLWRAQPGQPPDASGTTEALRLSKALWTGAQRFNRPQDRELALLILDGYQRHENEDQGLWLIRNYYGFGNGSFASNTFIIDYDPDYVAEVAEWHRTRDPVLHKRYSELAEKSYDVLEGARTNCGLIYDLLQPEVKTMYFDVPRIAYFSPNDIVQTNNSVATSSTVVHGRPHIPMGVLTFLHARVKRIHALYYGRTGIPVNERGLGGAEYAGMARLAAMLKSKTGVVAFSQRGMPFWDWIVSDPRGTDSPAWTVSELLLSMEEILRLDGSKAASVPIPATIAPGPPRSVPIPRAGVRGKIPSR